MEHKTLALFFAFAATVVTISAEFNVEKVAATFEKCRSSVGADPSEFENFKNKKMPTSESGKCLMGCLMKEMGLMVDGQLKKEGALKMAQTMYPNDAEKMKKAEAVIDACIAEVGTNKEECEQGVKIASCFQDHIKEANLHI